MPAQDNIVIMAAGSAERWGGYRGVPKQMVVIDGEPLLHRTIRQVHEWYGHEPFVTVPAIGHYGDLAATQIVGSSVVEVDKFLNATFDGTTLYLWGDVYFTNEAMDTIYTGSGVSPMFYGRAQGNTVKRWGELFAARLNPDAILKAHALRGIVDRLPRCASWELYRLINGYPLDEHITERGFVEIADATDDFDFPSDFDEWMATYRPVTEGTV